MNNIKEYIESGILEAYVLGLASPEERSEVETFAANSDEIRNALDNFSISFQRYAEDNATAVPHANLKPLVVASINYMNRMEKGETPSDPPMLHEGSKINDYYEWLNRSDMKAPENLTDIHAMLIANTPKATTAIVWIKNMAPEEVHHDEFERFLIVEGTCEITIGDHIHYLQPGDFLEIPLYKDHKVNVTSTIPCKVILQRVAA